ncbi:hypothetical protein [Priestia megaterium]|uniref:hypothetical protein n=1 Tax=Priestia megaterium TaxID=1404 RepID=UPI0034D46D25
MRIKEKVPVYYRKCGHTIEKVIIYEQYNMREKQMKINMYGKRFVCPNCQQKELGF